MRVRVLTLRYAEGVQGFPEDAVREACAGRELLEVREHFFVHGSVPHLSLVLLLSDEPVQHGERTPKGPDPMETLSDEQKTLYRQLREWRNQRAKKDGVPSYVIARNVQLAEVCRRVPRSKSALKEIEGIGEAMCAKYGDEILGLIPAETESSAPADGKPPTTGEQTEADP